jgi:hypothetical protein
MTELDIEETIHEAWEIFQAGTTASPVATPIVCRKRPSSAKFGTGRLGSSWDFQEPAGSGQPAFAAILEISWPSWMGLSPCRISRLPRKENSFAGKAVFPRHSGTSRISAASRFAFHSRQSKPKSGSLEQVASAIAVLMTHKGFNDDQARAR